MKLFIFTYNFIPELLRDGNIIFFLIFIRILEQTCLRNRKIRLLHNTWVKIRLRFSFLVYKRIA